MVLKALEMINKSLERVERGISEGVYQNSLADLVDDAIDIGAREISARHNLDNIKWKNAWRQFWHLVSNEIQ